MLLLLQPSPLHMRLDLVLRVLWLAQAYGWGPMLRNLILVFSEMEENALAVLIHCVLYFIYHAILLYRMTSSLFS